MKCDLNFNLLTWACVHASDEPSDLLLFALAGRSHPNGHIPSEFNSFTMADILGCSARQISEMTIELVRQGVLEFRATGGSSYSWRLLVPNSQHPSSDTRFQEWTPS